MQHQQGSFQACELISGKMPFVLPAPIAWGWKSTDVDTKCSTDENEGMLAYINI